MSTGRRSRKARNVAETGRAAAITIAVRRLPVGPPASVQFQTTATIAAVDDPEIVAAGRGRPPRPDHVPWRARPRPMAASSASALPARAVTYALGMSLLRVLRDPLDAAGEVDLRAANRRRRGS